MLNHLNFQRQPTGEILITNDFGEYAFLQQQDFAKLIGGAERLDEKTRQTLEAKHFLISESDLLDSEVFGLIRRLKSYVHKSTSLHIFVVTSRCNLQCVYCQAKANSGNSSGHMGPDIARKAVDIALQTPAKRLTFEFQGGEPLSNFDAIREIITYTEKNNKSKIIDFALVSNLALLTDEKLDFLASHNVSISTSLDGPKNLHDSNRRCVGPGSSYDLLYRGVAKMRKKGLRVGGIQTTTRASLPHPKEIVREYLKLGSSGVFLRPLTPLGYASSQWGLIGYSPEEYVQFYRQAFEEILSINQDGTVFPEQYASLLLKRILKGRGLDYMELRSPCGAGIGQLAYNYDGNVYTCDEARMVAEDGDQSFLLGNVTTHSYSDLVTCDVCRTTCAASITESVPGCCDCVYQPFCAVCPVVNYAVEKDLLPRSVKSYRCRINRGILDFLFGLLREEDCVTMRILNSWVGM